MNHKFKFTYLESFFQEARNLGYTFYTLKYFFENGGNVPNKSIALRVDIDFDPLLINKILDILELFSIQGSFFFRIHGKYNLFSFPVVKTIRRLIANNHELGLHSELVDMNMICGDDPKKLLKSNITMLENMFDTKIYGTASHGDHTGYNNLDFWKNEKPEDYNLLYEAYDDAIFKKGYYVSDSQVSRWKKYYKGILDDSGENDPLALIKTKEIDFICLLIHPDSFYHEHYHENIKY